MAEPVTGRAASTPTVRVSVAAPQGRVDVTLPARVPVAEVTAELRSRFGLPDPVQLTTVLGESLDPARAVGEQVLDGSILRLGSVDESDPLVFDDPADAIAHAAVTDHQGATLVGRVAAPAACALSLVGALAGFIVLPVTTGRLIAMAAVAATLLMLGVAASASRPEWAGTFGWGAVGYAVGAAAQASGSALTWLAPAVGLVVTCCLWVGMERGRLAIAPLALITPMALLGLAAMELPDSRVALPTVTILGLIVCAVALMALPRISLALAAQASSGQALAAQALSAGASSARAPSARGSLAWGSSAQKTSTRSEPVTLVRQTHQWLLVGLASVGALLALLVPLAALFGVASTCLAVDVCVAMMLGARWVPGAPSTCAAVASGLVPVVGGVVTALIWQPPWRTWAVLGLLIVAGMTAMIAFASARFGTHLALLADRAEWLTRFLLFPLAGWAVGLPSWASAAIQW
ncbi:MAG: EsaB/YukD family protein [Nocardioides sp.]